MVEIVVVHFVAMFSILLGKIVARANKEEIPHHISYHLLVEISIIHMFPVCVLKLKIRKF